MLRFIQRDGEALAAEAPGAAALAPYGDVLARLLWARGVRSAAEAEAFLRPSADQLPDPLTLTDMPGAVALLTQARDENWPAVVYGDYDVDGMCASAIMTTALRRFGVRADPYAPLRTDGYGLNLTAVETLSQSYRLLVTVDLGVTNHAEVARARELGMKVLVTDHHQLGETLPPADALLSPLLGGYARLCGAGVAYRVAQALLGEAADDLLDLAALATVADVVPLTGENRVLVALGLPLIGRRLGLRAMMQAGRISPPITSYTLGFQLGPRLNAAGRLGDANEGVRLLLTEDEAEAKAIAEKLELANAERRRVEQEIVRLADLQARGHDFVASPMLIARGEGWHEGVVGLAAGRLCQKYHAPTCVLSEREGMLHGSLRSVRGVNIFECLTACADVLARFGGHEQAAGVTLEAANFEAFRERLTDIVRQKAPADALAPEQEIDLPLPLSQATAGLCEELERLAPFGYGNPAPVFLCRGAAVERMRACGAEGAHLQLTLRQGASALDGIAFGMGALAQQPPETADAAFALQFNEYRGQRRLQMEVKALRPSRESEKAALRRAPLEKEQRSLLDAIAALQAGKRPSHGEMNKAVPGMETLLAGGQGTLLIARTRGMALAVLERCGERLDFCVGTAEDPRCFHTLLLWPDMDKLGGDWRRCVLLDGALDEKESAFVRARLPKAELYAGKISPALRALAASIDAGDEALRGLYKRLRGTVAQSAAQTASLSGLTPGQALAGLRAFDELGLIELGENPFSVALCEPKKCSLSQSALLRVLRALSAGEGGAAVC